MAEPKDSVIKILWEDDDLLVVGKPVGQVVDAGGSDSADLVSTVRAWGGAYSEVFAFHRLDRGTSGVVLLGKTRRHAAPITQAFEEKRIRKAYLAVVRGEWQSTLGRIESPIEERKSVTTFRRLGGGAHAGELASFIECLPKTGRTHQIRIHCASVDHPILGDTRYGKGLSTKQAAPAGGGVVDFSDEHDGHALHAYRLDFRHPASGETLTVRCEPESWRSTWLTEFDIEKVWSQLFRKDQT